MERILALVREKIKDDFKSILGKDLKGIIIYGSLARDEYIPRVSDINLLLLLEKIDFSHLFLCTKVIKKWKKERLSAPLLLTEDYISSSLDTFPLEFLNIKIFHILIEGIDPFENMEFSREHLRLQCEREAKAIYLKLWQSYLKSEGEKKALAKIISSSLSALFAISRGIAYLKGWEIPKKDRDMAASLSKNLGFSEKLWEDLFAIKEGKKLKKEEIRSAFSLYLKEIEILYRVADTL